MKKLVAYITVAYPDVAFTKDVILSLKENGADMIELGIPFSDPMADGPVIEKANLLSLQNGFKLDDLYALSNEVASQIDTLWMGYFNNFYHKGFDYTLAHAEKAGVSGFIIPDLPHEEAVGYQNLAQGVGIDIISFIAPTHKKERIKMIASQAQKFIYLVAYAGITGSGASEDLSEVVENIKTYTKTPVFVGFGVNEKTAKEKSQNVDGVIVGSAFVKILLDESLTNSEKIARISSLAKRIKEIIN